MSSLDKDSIKIEQYPPTPSGMRHNGPRSGIIVHHESGISVASQAERSQHKNKVIAISILEGYLNELSE